VENKAKAKKQAEHRAQQQANIEKQRLEKKEKLAEGKDKKQQQKKSRGAIQREKKRKQKEGLENGEPREDSIAAGETGRRSSSSMPTVEHKTRQKVKAVKPPKKKRKVDAEEQNFENLVDSYRKAFSGVSELKGDPGIAKTQTRPKKAEKRWFE